MGSCRHVRNFPRNHLLALGVQHTVYPIRLSDPDHSPVTLPLSSSRAQGLTHLSAKVSGPPRTFFSARRGPPKPPLYRRSSGKNERASMPLSMSMGAKAW